MAREALGLEGEKYDPWLAREACARACEIGADGQSVREDGSHACAAERPRQRPEATLRS